MGYDDWERDMTDLDFGALSMSNNFAEWAGYLKNPTIIPVDQSEENEIPYFTFYKRRFDHLPDDIVISIFSYLDFPAFTRLYGAIPISEC